MTVHLTVVSASEHVVGLVGDFARGLGCGLQPVPVATGRAEPVCGVTYRHPGVSSSATVTLRVAEVSIDSTAPPGV